MHLPDQRAWIGLGCYTLCLVVLAMYVIFPELRHDDQFKSLTTLIVGAGFINTVVPWGYGSTKDGNDLATGNQAIVAAASESASASTAATAAQVAAAPVAPVVPAAPQVATVIVVDPSKPA